MVAAVRMADPDLADASIRVSTGSQYLGSAATGAALIYARGEERQGGSTLANDLFVLSLIQCRGVGRTFAQD